MSAVTPTLLSLTTLTEHVGSLMLAKTPSPDELSDKASHAGTVPLLIAGVALLVAAIIVRKIIKLAILVAIVGAIAIGFSAWRSGVLTD